MSISYVCSECNKKLKMLGFQAVNEVGRKYCSCCGTNIDDLIVVDRREFESRVRRIKEKE